MSNWFSDRRPGARLSAMAAVGGALLLVLFVGSARSSGGYADAVLSDSPVGYWRLAEGSGTSITDGLGAGHGGSYSGTVTLGQTSPITTDTGDSAAYFNGGWGSIPYYSDLNPTANKLSIEFWWKGSVPNAARFMVLKGFTSHDDPYYQYGVGDDTTGKVRVVVDTSGTFSPWDTGIAWPTDGAWHQIVVTYDGSLSSNNLKLYIDAVQRAQTNKTGNVRGYSSALGLMDILNLGSGFNTTGRLDEVSIYNSALSSARISAHYDAATVASPAAPTNSTLPHISGTAIEGQTLATGSGSWSGSPTSYAYQWRRCNSVGASCSDISAATSASYTLVSADVGSTIRAAVTATNAGGSTTALSGATAVVLSSSATASYRQAAMADDPVGYWRLSEGSGTTITDELSSGHGGSYSGTVTLGQTSPIASDGSDSAAYFNGGWGSIPYYSDLNPTGDKLSIEFWWKGTAPSAARFMVLKGYTSHSDPYYQYGVGDDTTGKVRVIVDTSGTFSPWDTGVPWPSDGAWHQIVVTYDGSLASNNLKLYIDAVQQAQTSKTGNVRGYSSALGLMDILNLGAGFNTTGRLDDVSIYDSALSSTRIGAHYDAATIAAPSNSTLPSISGTPTEGQALAASPGSWTGSPTGYAYQWRRCDSSGASCADISGATASSYTLVSADIGGKLRVAVTATNSGGSTTATSNTTAIIGGSPPVNTSPPQISGPVVAGDTLRATPGTWTGSPTSYTYQWSRCDVDGSNCSEVDGAQGSRFLLNADDVGHKFKLTVDAQNPNGSTPTSSEPTSSTTSGAPADAWAPAPSGGVIVGDPYYTGYHWTWHAPGWSDDLPDGGWAFELEGGNGVNNDLFYHCQWIAVLGASTCDDSADMRAHAFKLAQEYARGLVETTANCGPYSDHPMPCYQALKDAHGLLPGEDWGLCEGVGRHRVCVSKQISDPVSPPSGDYVSTHTDLRLYGEGVPFELTRTYNSADHGVGPLGRGWSWSLGPKVSIFDTLQASVQTEDGARLFYDKRSSLGRAPGVRSSLTSDISGYVLTRPDQVKYIFTPAGRVQTIKDRNGLGLTFSYDGDRLTSVTDSAGRGVSIGYDAEGHVVTVELPDGRSVTYGYTDGLLSSVEDSRGNTTTYTYDEDGNLLTETDPNGHTVVTNTYDEAGRIHTLKDGLDHLTSLSWDASNETETSTDARGHDWKDIYSGGVLVERIDPLGATTHYGHDGAFNLTSETDARGNTTTMTYDDRGNLLSRTAPDPLDYTESYTYDTLNDVTSFTDGRGHETTYGYDTHGNLTSKTQPGELTTTYGRNPTNGRLTSITTPRDKTTSFAYDADGNLASITSPLGELTTLGYDSSGRLTSRVDPRGHITGVDPSDFTTSFAYDEDDHLTSTADALGDTSSVSYDDAGNVIGSTDQNGNSTSYGYDAANQLTSVTAPPTPPVSGTTTYGYDAVGNLTTRTDPNSHDTAYTYDDANRLDSVVTPLDQKWTYTYDADGNVVSQVDAAGNETGAPAGTGTTLYGYDVLNRPTSIDYSDSTPDVSFDYDANGNRTAMTDGAGTETSAFDALDRLSTVTRGLDVFAYEYNDDGAVTSRTYPDGTQVAYSYDDDGRLATVTNAGATTSYGYDAAGNLATTTLPATNGYVESRGYDRAGRLVDIETVKGATTLEHFAYTLDAVGNPVSIGGGDPATYQYDARDRLTEICYQATCPDPADPFIRYSYDGVGNRLSLSTPDGTTTYSYDAADELVSEDRPAGTLTYDFDADGREVQAGSRTFAYDLASRLTSTTDGSTTTDYTYDGTGNRLESTVGSDNTEYLWDKSNPLPELAVERDGLTGSSLRSYVYGGDLLAMRSGGASFFFQRDAIGSVTDVTSSSGDLERSYTYDPFGNVRVSTRPDPAAPDNVIGFAGQMNDVGSGMEYMRARTYDSSNGRFLTRDPLPPVQTQPYASTYIYANARPTSLVDPTGMGPVWRDENTCGSLSCWASDPHNLWDSVRYSGAAAACYEGYKLTKSAGALWGLSGCLALAIMWDVGAENAKRRIEPDE